MNSILKTIEEIKKHKRQDKAPRGLFPASAADRWLNCPKSSYLSKDIPQETSIYAEEGILAHKVCEAVYHYRMNCIPYPKELNAELAKLDDCGEEMEGYAEDYYKFIKAITKDPKLGKILYVMAEKYVYVDDVRDTTRMAGLADYMAIGTKGALVVDFKYGKGHAVDPEHPQLRTYLTALRGIDVPDYEFHAYIYQPRIHSKAHKRFDYVKTYTRQDLLDHYEKIKKVREAYINPNTPLKYGSHCQWCPAKRTSDLSKKCPIVDKKQTDSLWEKVLEATMAMEKAKTSVGQDRDKHIKDFFSVLPELMNYKTIFEKELLDRLDAGESIKGFKMTERPGRRKWSGTPEEVGAQLERMFPDKLGGNYGATVEKMRTITEIEKRIGKGHLDAFTTVSPSSKKLVVTDETPIDEILAQVEIQ